MKKYMAILPWISSTRDWRVGRNSTVNLDWHLILRQLDKQLLGPEWTLLEFWLVKKNYKLEVQQ